MHICLIFASYTNIGATVILHLYLRLSMNLGLPQKSSQFIQKSKPIILQKNIVVTRENVNEKISPQN